MADYLDPDGQEFFAQVATYLRLDDRQRVREAFELARREHGDERRKSGELFFTHPLTVAYYLAEYYVDAPALIAALLHDVAEDTSVSVEEIESQFGQEVGLLVDGLTKFDKFTAQAKLGRELTASEMKAATHHKLFEMMISDMRVGIIKVFDRLHNMRTIKAMPEHKQREKARETMTVYAPLANRLGMWRIKNELEQLSLEILDAHRYQAMMAYLDKQTEKQHDMLTEIGHRIMSSLTEFGVTVVDVVSATPDISTLYQSWKQYGVSDFDRVIHLPLTLVVLVRDLPSCYVALGHIHGLWQPVPNKFDDYIARPRENMYRSLHTTVLYNGQMVKIRIRTLSMQVESQSGVLAQWLTDAGLPLWSDEASKRMAAMLNTISINMKKNEEELSEGVRSVLDDVLSHQIMVYTPRGDARELPLGATPIDFAYTIHTVVGHSCRAASVNGLQVPLTYTLQEGDSVKIARRGSTPQRIWLDEDLGYLKTASARSIVRRWFRRLSRPEAIAEGRQLLKEELKLLGLPEYDQLAIAQMMNFVTVDDLCYALGRAEVSLTAVSTKVLSETWIEESTQTIGQAVQQESSGEWFVIANAGNRPLRLCRTCTPRPGDPILGYIRTNNQVTVHTMSCSLIPQDAISTGRALKLRWSEEGKVRGRNITLRIDVHDRDGLLSEIADMMRDEEVNITMICSRSVKNKATIVLGMEASNPRQVVRLLHKIQAMVNIISVACINHHPTWVAATKKQKKKNLSLCPFDVLEHCAFHPKNGSE